MPKRSLLSVLLPIGFLVFVYAFGALAAGAQTNCQDPKIVSDIYSRIKADKGLMGQTSHINVSSLYGAVMLQGWTDTSKDYDRLISFVFANTCVRLVNSHSLASTPPPPDSPARAGAGCSSGMKACGDICIPSGDTCNIGAVQ